MSQATGNKVSLGCGTLILIALIVLLFGNSGGTSDLKREVRALKNELRSLDNKTSELHADVKNIEIQLQSQNEVLRQMNSILSKLSAPPPPAEKMPADPKVESE
ncbi:hypothetical protein [Luteolibacter luteus]|uniref:Uncharacterized protein n=1 Tax=Luteolibacter luteus TaxID=2728835 RepID=A0A858RH43_9BACT|nr:hypothetical protein [Luteolibacter luteus]QJE95864.1 hypothetical protein HHL09_08735 [Luteolibacter luteus]